MHCLTSLAPYLPCFVPRSLIFTSPSGSLFLIAPGEIILASIIITGSDYTRQTLLIIKTEHMRGNQGSLTHLQHI